MEKRSHRNLGHTHKLTHSHEYSATLKHKYRITQRPYTPPNRTQTKKHVIHIHTQAQDTNKYYTLPHAHTHTQKAGRVLGRGGPSECWGGSPLPPRLCDYTSPETTREHKHAVLFPHEVQRLPGLSPKPTQHCTATLAF